jgi:dienelactone hydrolase
MTVEVNGPPSLSVDGRYAAWLSSGGQAPVLILVDVERRSERARLRAPGARCRGFTWSMLPTVGLAVAHGDGSENWTLYRLDAEKRTWTALGGPTAEPMSVCGLSELRPEEVLVAIPGRDPRYPDYDVVSLRTCDRTPVFENPGYAAVYFDRRFAPRLVETVNEDGSRELRHADAEGSLFLRIPHEDALCVRFLEFAADGRTALFTLPDGENDTCLAELSCVAGEPAGEPVVVHRVHGGDLAIVPPGSKEHPDMVLVEGARIRCVGLSPGIEATLRELDRRMSAASVVMERRDQDRVWLVGACDPVSPAEYFVFEPETATLWRLSEARPGHKRPKLDCEPVSVPARDGNRIPAYVTRPTAADQAPAPTVLLVHGGPWRRSSWRYSERRAWLAEQGYTVIEPNFRGSTGFGTAWVNAADGEWGGRMQQDLEDSLDWAVRQGIADAGRIALFGGSYGGYAVLQLAATSNVAFRCVVATSPLTDLVEFVSTPPPFWLSARPMLKRRIGDPDIPDRRADLEARSPVHSAEGIDCPVLLVHGVTDSRVPAQMAQRMFLALARSGKDAALALFPGEGHEIVGTANRAVADRLIARQLSTHLLGRATDQDPTEDLAESTLRLFESPWRSRAAA